MSLNWPRRIHNFWARVHTHENGCWVWRGAVNADGYGHVTVSEQKILAHRFAWTISRGPIPNGMLVLHRCDNPQCVNPDHLWIGTNADNLADMRTKGRCSPGQLLGRRGELNGRSTLSEIDVRTIRRLHATGITCADLARIWPVNAQTISNIVRGVRWRHVESR